MTMSPNPGPQSPTLGHGLRPGSSPWPLELASIPLAPAWPYSPRLQALASDLVQAPPPRPWAVAQAEARPY